MSQRAWNQLAAEFEDAVCDITATSGDQLAEIVAQAHPNRRQTLVDAGCGIGTFVERFGPRFGKVLAFDFATAMVKRARRRCRDLTNVTWHALPLEDAGEQFGPIAHLAVCLNVITSPDAELRVRQWRSLVELVRPGGRLLVVVPSLESARFVAEAEGNSFWSDADLIIRTDTRQKHYGRQELRRLLTAEGLRVLSLRRLSYPWAEEGAEHLGTKTPWDWACLARRP